MHLLVMENDAPLGEFIRSRLQEDGFSVDIAVDGIEARRLVDSRAYDLVILDLSPPSGSGMEVLRHIRSTNPDLLILLLGGGTCTEDRVRGLDAGADDYVTKPFSHAELSARIRALFRRANGLGKVVLKVEDLELDRIGRIVRRGGCTINLTHKEFALLDFLMQRPLQPVPRNMIVEQAWKLSTDSVTNAVDVYINSLRKKIDSGFDHPLIRTIRGVGYQIGGG